MELLEQQLIEYQENKDRDLAQIAVFIKSVCDETQLKLFNAEFIQRRSSEIVDLIEKGNSIKKAVITVQQRSKDNIKLVEAEDYSEENSRIICAEKSFIIVTEKIPKVIYTFVALFKKKALTYFKEIKKETAPDLIIWRGIVDSADRSLKIIDNMRSHEMKEQEHALLRLQDDVDRKVDQNNDTNSKIEILVGLADVNETNSPKTNVADSTPSELIPHHESLSTGA